MHVPRRVVCLAVATCLPVLLLNGRAAAINVDPEWGPDYTWSFCVLSVPSGVSLTNARARLNDAIAEWETPGNTDGGTALSLTSVTTTGCTGADIKITSGTPSVPSAVAETRDTRDEIRMNSAFDFWDGSGTYDGTKWSYLGVLTHEMGHVFALFHEGGSNWSKDGFVPTMEDCPSAPSASVALESLAQEDWGGASWVRGGARAIWTSNPGFEDGWTHWGRSAGTSMSSTYAFAGSQGVRLSSSSDYVFITHTYDPWVSSGNLNTAAMDSTPLLAMYGNYKNPSGTSGGVKVQVEFRYMQYTWATSGCRSTNNSSVTYTPLSVLTTLENCATSSVWATCEDGMTVTVSSTNDAVMWRSYMSSNSASGVYIDRFGGYGGVTRL